MAITTTINYDSLTESMQVGPEASRSFGFASESRSGALFTGPAACAGRVDLDWVPAQEQSCVPSGLAGLCRSCPGRARCLRTAIATGSDGYWAGTTRDDRLQMAGEGQVSLRRADQLQAAAHDAEDAALQLGRRLAKHPPGQGSLRWYRRAGCRCPECRGCNTAARADERARARRHGTAAA